MFILTYTGENGLTSLLQDGELRRCASTRVKPDFPVTDTDIRGLSEPAAKLVYERRVILI